MISLFRRLKDPVSGLTHFIGALLAVAALVLLIVKSASPPKPWHIVTYAIFGAGLILLYSASTLFHWIPATGRTERWLQRLDHSMIFVLIAASYTPVCLIPMRGGWGWSLFGSVWGLAITGIISKIFWLDLPRWLITSVYVALGWLVLVAIWPLFRSLQPGAFTWLLIGGAFYTVGALIYALNRPRLWPRWFGSHELFHVLVMLGSASHFWVMYHYIARFE